MFISYVFVIFNDANTPKGRVIAGRFGFSLNTISTLVLLVLVYWKVVPDMNGGFHFAFTLCASANEGDMLTYARTHILSQTLPSLSKA